MAHELSFTNGVADFFEIGERSAWHREGVALPVGTSFTDALAAGNLLYPVEKQTAYRKLSDGSVVALESGAVTVRTDTDKELGMVGADYSVVQNEKAFSLIRPLLEDGSLRLETGGVLRNGADAWVLAQINLTAFPSEISEKLHKEAIAKYLMVRTNHTARANASVTETDVRVVCANTLGMVERGDYRASASVKHRGDASGRLDVAFKLVLGGIVQRTSDFLSRYDALHSRILTEKEWQTLVMDKVQGDPRTFADFDPKGSHSDSVVARYTEKRNALFNLWHNGKGHVGDNSAWEAYNGVVEAIDHNVGDLFPTRTSRARQLMPGGRLFSVKDEVYQSLLATD